MPYEPPFIPTPYPAIPPNQGNINPTPNDGSVNAGQYAVQTVSLAAALNNQLLTVGPGQFFAVIAGTAGSTATVTFDQSTTAIPIYPGIALNVQFSQAFITAPAQASMSMTILSSPTPDFARL